MGTSAAPAIPDLIDTYYQGVAGHPPNTNLFMGYTPNLDPIQRNRGAALQALGRIGIASSNVLKTLADGWVAPHAAMRALSADAVGCLGVKALPLLPSLLQCLDRTNRAVLEFQIEAIGKMGPGATEAVPALLYWANDATVPELSSGVPLGRSIRWFDDPPPLPAGAAIALVRVAPDQAVGFGRLIATALTPQRTNPGGEQSIEKLKILRPLADEIIPALEPFLEERERGWVPQLTAMQILCLDPGHSQARSLLLKAMQPQTNLVLRAQAATFFWRVTGETNQPLAVLRDALSSVRGSRDQPALSFTTELGLVAKPLAAQIQPLLTNEDWAIRDLAGKALRRINPELLPALHLAH
jgi:hypothetical protein